MTRIHQIGFAGTTLAAFAGAAALSTSAHAAVLLTGADQLYTENFDSLTAAVTTFTDNSTLAGWYVDGANPAFDAPGTTLSVTANTGTFGGGGLFSAGTATERSFGFRNFNDAGDWYKGVQFQNTTTETIEYEEINISLVVEKWQDRGQNEFVQLAFKETSSGGNILNDSGWTNVDSATIADDPGGSGAIDGNLTANQTVLTATLNNITLTPGEFLTIRYLDDNVNGNDNALAIDDVSVSFVVPEPGSLSLAAMGGLVCLVRRRRSNR